MEVNHSRTFHGEILEHHFIKFFFFCFSLLPQTSIGKIDMGLVQPIYMGQDKAWLHPQLRVSEAAIQVVFSSDLGSLPSP